MKVYPHQTQFDFGDVLHGLKLSASQFASDTQPGIIVSYTVENTTHEERSISLGFLVNVDLFPVWFSEENGIHNGPDTVEWNKEGELFTAKDSLHQWYMAWNATTMFPPTKQETNLSGLKARLRLPACIPHFA